MSYCDATRNRYPFGYGGFVFVYDTIVVTVTNPKFFGDNSGEGFASYLAYDRYKDDSQLLVQQPSQLGYAYITGPRYPAPYKFSWNLQLLPLDIYEALWAIYDRQQLERQPCQLRDYHLAMGEPGPRRRGRTQPATNPAAAPGMVYFYPMFNIWLEMPASGRRYQGHDFFALRFMATEISPATPVPTSFDLS